MQEKLIILDFGSQYTQLIARRVRELNVYCEIFPYNKEIKLDASVKGVILSGSPFSVRDKNAPIPDLSQIKQKYPLLGVCYGAQFLANNYNGKVLPSKHREFGRARLSYINKDSKLFSNIEINSQVWMSHGDTITKLPDNSKIIASTQDVKVGAFRIDGEETFGIQFHPEVYHTLQGKELLKNFLVDICGFSQDWTADAFAELTINSLKEQLGNDKVVLGLSGGVDSSVAGVLLSKAIGENLTCIFIDNGLLRKNEYEKVLKSYNNMGLNVIGVDAKDKFLKELKGISDPESKRKAIGKAFIDIFDEEANKIKNVKWLAQGTIYPDVIESISVNGPSQTIKSHHNVGGLPDKMNLKIVEPLKLLFKDEVRRVGAAIGVKQELLKRHPFPGPGLSIRILGDITSEKVRILQEVDDIYIEGLIENNLYDKVWQAGVILLPVQSVGVMGDERTYENAVALRAV
ncbi:MAG: glutamine-hydrolyzing GMP synthase, partial [Bacteroidota bacterium]|nr:glutamine-hydrolyzing GMP synthase [Bacteroidota bacterium]